MMTIDYIAALCESMYYSGRPKANRRFDLEDFKQLVRMRNAAIMRQMYYEAKQNGQDHAFYFQDALVEKNFKIKGNRNKKGVVTIDMGEYLINLPANMGIFSVSPGEDSDCQDKDFMRMPAGSNPIMAGEAFEGVPWFHTIGKKLKLYNCEECVEDIDVTAIFNDENIVIPSDIATLIVEWVKKQVMESPTVVDKTNDNNPNTEN